MLLCYILRRHFSAFLSYWCEFRCCARPWFVSYEGVRCESRRKTGICRVRMAESIMYWSIPQGHSAWAMQCRADRNLWRHLTLTVRRASPYECLPVPIRDPFQFSICGPAVMPRWDVQCSIGVHSGNGRRELSCEGFVV
jgi:hypothetical protein